MSGAARRLPAPDPGDGDDERVLEELRALLVASERERLETLERAGVDAEDVADVLPEAILRRELKDDRIARALGNTIEAGLFRSARKDPQALADAIHPALGPAIRGMIQATLRDSLERLNVALENSLSPQGIRWRLEAARTGQSFSEVVLLKTMVYRVEQALLMQSESGLVIREERALDAGERDADLVAGMLSAIRDFAADSFSGGEVDPLEEVEFEGRTLILAHGPSATLALVVQGSPPRTLRARAREVVDEVHVAFGEELDAFEGEEDALPGAAPLLEDLLVSEARERKPNRLVRVIPIAAGLLLVGWALWATVVGLQARTELRAIRQELDAAPGVRAFEVARDGDTIVASGMADPWAPLTPEAIIRARVGETSDLRLTFEPIVSLDAACVVERARRMLALTDDDRPELRGGDLVLFGIDPGSERAERIAERAPFVVGVERAVFLD